MAKSIKHICTFYADTMLQKNKLFSWKVDNAADAKACVKRFQLKGFIIRAAWHNVVRDGVVLQRNRIA